MQQISYSRMKGPGDFTAPAELERDGPDPAEVASLAVRAELVRRPAFILEAMQELGDDFAAALNAGDADAVQECCRAALIAYADALRKQHQKTSLARDVSDEAAYSYLLRVYSSGWAA